MKDLDFFKNEALNRSLCSTAVSDWANSVSKEDFFEFSLKPSSIPYMSLAMREGWGLSVEYIIKEFADFINGKETAEVALKDRTISGQMYVGFEGKREVNASIVNVVNSNIYITTKRYATSIHVNNDSHVTLELPDDCFITIYLYDKSTIRLVNTNNHQKVYIYDYRKEEDIDYEFVELKSENSDDILRKTKVDKGINIEDSHRCNFTIKKRNLNISAYGVNHYTNKK